MQRGNFYANLPDASGGEVMEVLSRMTGGKIRVERIVTDAADAETWYDQAWPEWVMVLRGGAELEFAEPAAEEVLASGDWLLVPAHCRHRVRWAEAGTIWLAVHADGGS